MEVSEVLFPFQGSVLHFIKAGTGKQNLLLFHGFGQDHQVFNDLIRTHGDQYTFYAFDLFFHGKSAWNHGEQPISKECWKDCLHSLLKAQNLKRFSVAGFSLGARFALATVEGFASQIDQVFLMAPDGIRPSLWYRLATEVLPMRIFFRSMIGHPKRFFSLTRLARGSGLVDKGVIRFAESQMNTEERRAKVYYSWVVFRQLSYHWSALARLINHYDLPVTLIVGENDNVITASDTHRFSRRLKHSKTIVLKTGHHGLISKIVSERLLNPLGVGINSADS